MASLVHGKISRIDFIKVFLVYLQGLSAQRDDDDDDYDAYDDDDDDDVMR